MDFKLLLEGSIIASLLVQVGKEMLGIISKRWGALASQFTLLVVSFAIAGIGAWIRLLPPDILQATYTIFASAMVVYEVVYKAIYKDAILGGK